MSINTLKRMYEERRVMLLDTLKNRREELIPSQQHQIYGAIKEIEGFLDALSKIRDFTSQNRIGTTIIENDLSSDDKTIIEKLSEGTKSFSERVIIINKKIAGGIGKFFKGIGNTFLITKEVLQEVKKRKKESYSEKQENNKK